MFLEFLGLPRDTELKVAASEMGESGERRGEMEQRRKREGKVGRRRLVCLFLAIREPLEI